MDVVFRSSRNDPQFCSTAVRVAKPNSEILIISSDGERGLLK